MRIFLGRAGFASDSQRPRSPALAIGNFDGVHLGHRALIDAARGLASAPGAAAGVLTFDPHPARLFAPSLAPPLITTLERRIELLGEAGAEFVVVEPFTRELAAIEAEQFVSDVLVAGFGAQAVVVGHDFGFGRKRSGSPALLAATGARLGINVTVVPPFGVDGLICSSTKIREFVLEGRVEGAALLLGRPFELGGKVVTGAGRGRTFGVPTANIRPEIELLPRGGVYAARARLADGGSWPAAINIGTNPTFDDTGVTTVEAHLLNFAGELYGQHLTLDFHSKLRDERRFTDKAALVAQIWKDIARTRELVT